MKTKQKIYHLNYVVIEENGTQALASFFLKFDADEYAKKINEYEDRCFLPSSGMKMNREKCSYIVVEQTTKTGFSMDRI